ncbi:hypothetical protein R6V09_26810 [Streptomyces sp. W16]|uniref:hypothetical protein n=1 Tax=Streptomyces sp. W16 TaxID=3076631 RepID=UPI00295B5E47|nr:hypothetical protein [Streptomyces sp. W16]MDV9173700.1 hypothetical protein [Streptomyces sp. W16]
MIRAVRALPLLLLLPALLTGCGTEKAGAGMGAGTVAGSPKASASAAPSPATAAEITSRARALGFDPDLVYVIDPPGFTLAQQSVGVSDVGLSVSYTSPKNGAVINLRVEPGTMTDANCTTQAVTTEHMTCVRDGNAWYRTGGGDAEYVLAAKGHLVHVAAEQGEVSREVLRESARSLRRPYESELAEILPSRAANGTVGEGS